MCCAPASSATWAAPGTYKKEYEPEGSQGYFFGDYCNWARIPEYRDFVYNSEAAALAGRLMGSSTARFFHEHVLVKEPLTESRTPWHHDLPYYCIDGTQCVSFWTALDPVPRAVCLELVAGSHRWGKSFMPKKFVGVDYRREGEALDTMPDIDARRDEFEIVSFDVAPGDAIAFHFLTVHGAPGNASASARRRAFVHRWVGDDVRFKVRPGEVSPPFPEAHEAAGRRRPPGRSGVPARLAGLGLKPRPLGGAYRTPRQNFSARKERWQPPQPAPTAPNAPCRLARSVPAATTIASSALVSASDFSTIAGKVVQISGRARVFPASAGLSLPEPGGHIAPTSMVLSANRLLTTPVACAAS